MSLRDHARTIWDAAVDAVRPGPLVRAAVADIIDDLRRAPRILVVGAGKAGADMASAFEDAASNVLDRVEGVVNVPDDAARPLRRIRLHAARPGGSNHPTAAGVAGMRAMLDLMRSAGPDDAAVCLMSGGGSALLPAPADGVVLADKQAITKQLHGCGATIVEMNAVRKHLSAIKGGLLAEAFRGRLLVGLIISDVVGDPLDAVGSGPTAPDASTFAECLAVLDRYGLRSAAPAVLSRIERGAAGLVPETPKTLPGRVVNRVIGNNALALRAASAAAERLGYRVVNLGSFVEGETRPVATAFAGVARSIRVAALPVAPPACLLVGGETTVTLTGSSGKGGRNQEFALAALRHLGPQGMDGVAILSGGTDGEDGPTDAAGAVVDASTWDAVRRLGLDVEGHLSRHDAYPLLDAAGALIRTGLTGTNVMDVRMALVGPSATP